MDSKEPSIFETEIESASNDTYSTEDERAIVRKMDFLHVMPFVFMVSWIQSLDKLAINYAAVLGIMADTHITNNQFGFIGSAFYIGILVFQIPITLLIQRFSVKTLLGIFVTSWGLVLTLTALATTYSQLVALRFLLGLLESSSNPCCVLIIDKVYRRNEKVERNNYVNVGSAAALTFGSLIAYGIGYMDNIRGLHSWQWLMIIFGSFTILLGICTTFLMVDDPKSKMLRLTPEQRKIVDFRMLDKSVTVSKTINYDQIIECFKEPRYYCMILASILVNFQAGSLQTFSSIIINNFGFSKLDSILLGMPNGIIKVLFSFAGAWYVSRYGHIHYAMFIACGVEALGILLIIVIPLYKAKIAGLYIAMTTGFVNILFYTSAVNNIAGYTKKIFYVNSISAGIMLGHVIGPLMMVDAQKPLYLGGMIACLVGDVISIFLLWICRHSMAKINKERLNNVSEPISERKELTDKEDPRFIYSL